MLKSKIRSLLLLLILSISSLLGAEQSYGLLAINANNEAVLPRNFRSTTDPFKINTPPLPSREGFDSLRLSGSAQFSEKSLEIMLKQLKNPPNFYILDLREEYHGFIDGTPISWYALRNWSNVGKTVEEIEQGEKQLLDQALKKKNVLLARIVDKYIGDHEEYDYSSIPIKVNSAITEEQLAAKYQLKYKRLPVTDHSPPTGYSIDRFVSFVKELPEDHWLHIHCAAGMGRTTTFMAMYDMMKNAKKVSFEDIMRRQWYIGGRNLIEISNTYWKHQLSIDRLGLLRKFYDYARTNQDNFETTWSKYVVLKTASSAMPAEEDVKKN